MRSLNSQISVLIVLLVVFACQPENDLFKEARTKVLEAEFISYDEISMWENPMDRKSLVDTIPSYNEFSLNDQSFVGYDFKMISDRYDVIFQGGEYRLIAHDDQVVEIYTPLQFENRSRFEKRVKGTSFRWSPITFLSEDWTHYNDTIINESKYAEYFQVEKDTVYEGQKVYVERHMFINQETALLERFERRAYDPDGTIGQLISKDFYNYEISSSPNVLSYEEPETYTSTYGRRKQLERLTEGEVAPSFKLLAMNGDSLSLDQFRGKKVMLNFSVINCGFCQMALKHMNRDDFALNDKVEWIYVNPEDSKEKLDVYTKKLSIPYPALINAKEVGEKYGVNGYPMFFLIDEEGVIEKIQPGYKASFIDEYSI